MAAKFFGNSQSSGNLFSIYIAYTQIMMCDMRGTYIGNVHNFEFNLSIFHTCHVLQYFLKWSQKQVFQYGTKDNNHSRYPTYMLKFPCQTTSSKTTGQVQLNGQTSDKFQMDKGTKQDNNRSPSQFNIVTDEILKNTKKQKT